MMFAKIRINAKYGLFGKPRLLPLNSVYRKFKFLF